MTFRFHIDRFACLGVALLLILAVAGYFVGSTSPLQLVLPAALILNDRLSRITLKQDRMELRLMGIITMRAPYSVLKEVRAPGYSVWARWLFPKRILLVTHSGTRYRFPIQDPDRFIAELAARSPQLRPVQGS